MFFSGLLGRLYRRESSGEPQTFRLSSSVFELYLKNIRRRCLRLVREIQAIVWEQCARTPGARLAAGRIRLPGRHRKDLRGQNPVDKDNVITVNRVTEITECTQCASAATVIMSVVVVPWRPYYRRAGPAPGPGPAGHHYLS